VGAALIELGDPPERWRALGFAPDARGDVMLGEATLRLTGEGGGIRVVRVEGLTGESPDGLPLGPAEGSGWGSPPPGGPSAAAPAGGGGGASPHPNGAVAGDHVVALTDALDRTLTALQDAGLDLRRRAGAMAFLRLGPFILEVVERAPGPPWLWGLAVVTPALDRLGPLVGAPKDAVQPGRRIATVSREAGLGTALALMTPRRT